MIGKRITTTGDASTGRTTLRGLIAFPSGTGTPRLTLSNDTSGGTEKFDISLPTDVTAGVAINFPGNGILFREGVHVKTFDAIDHLTLFVGQEGA